MAMVYMSGEIDGTFFVDNQTGSVYAVTREGHGVSLMVTPLLESGYFSRQWDDWAEVENVPKDYDGSDKDHLLGIFELLKHAEEREYRQLWDGEVSEEIKNGN